MIASYVRAHRSLSVAAVVLAFLIEVSCDKAALTAPTDSTITIFSNTTIVPLGGSAEITAQVFASGGIPVHNGTVVTFTSTIGTFDLTEARTKDGVCTVRLFPGNVSGKASVHAFSGGITSEELALTIGASAVNKVTLGSSQSTVPSAGGTVSLFAVVVDADGNPVPNVPVNFTTTAGTLGANNVPTDGSGRATTTLTTSSTAQVTATAGTVSSTTLTITAAARPSVTVSASTTSPNVGQVVSFTVSVTPASGTAGTAIQSVNINFGDGKSSSLGLSGGPASNTYGSAGTYTVTATARDANGETGSGSVIIVVNPVLLGLTATPNSGAPPLNVAFSLTVNPSTAAVSSVDWDFGDGEMATGTPQLTINHVYIRSGTWTATATVHFAGGATPAKAQVIVRIAQ